MNESLFKPLGDPCGFESVIVVLFWYALAPSVSISKVLVIAGTISTSNEHELTGIIQDER